ncbi:MAG: helix-turn-helix domain-containing protein [Nannocystaceae bacterium]
MEPEILSAKEVMALLRISRNTLYRWAKRGKIPGSFRVGRSWRFRKHELLHSRACMTLGTTSGRKIR